MGVDPGTVAEGQRLSGRLIDAAERAKADFAAMVGELGLTSVQARALLRLGEPVPMRALAAQLCCDASNVTAIADGLEASGLVTRAPAEDRRVKLLRLTERGEQVRAELAVRVSRGALVMRLSPEQRRTLEDLLDALLA